MSVLSRLPLRQMLTLPYVALVVALAAAIGALSYQAGGQAVDALSDRLLSETADRLAQAVRSHVLASHTVLELAFPAEEAAPASLSEQVPALRTRFWLATEAHRDPNNYAYYGDAQGRFFGLWRHDARRAELRLRDDAGPRRILAFEGLHGALQPGVTEQRSYDPRDRPWYRVAMARDAVAWTPIYIDFRSGGLVTTLARPVRDAQGRARGVVATDVSLAHIDQFLRGLAISRNGLAFVTDATGHLIGASQGHHVQRRADGQAERLAASDSDHPLIAATYRAFQAQRSPRGAEGIRHDVLTLADGQRVQVAHARVTDAAGLDWTVLVAVPREDFLQHVTRSFQQTALLGAAASVGVLFLGLAVLSVVARDLRQLADAARRIGEGRSDHPASLHRRDEIGELARSLAAMQQRLTTDALTGLANREALLRRLDERIGQHRRHSDDRPFGLLFVDLNGFKAINDLHGHAVGDRVLQQLAVRLRSAVRSQDLVARYAGDEFLLLLDALPDRATAERLRAEIERRLAEPLPVLQALAPGVEGASGAVGLALFPDDARDAQTLVRLADEDMYRRKRLKGAADAG